jgi:hypothetical protein
MLKKISIVLFIVFLIVAGVFFFKNQKAISPDVSDKEIQNQQVSAGETRSLCYLYSKKTDRNFYDAAWLRLDLNGEKVTGEFYNLPAEKDTKVGKFSGTVGALDQQKMARTADVWWDSLGEGMKVTEELLIDFGDGSASVGFGEMVDRGDGVYIYKDKSNITYRTDLNQIACEDLGEKLAVEKYVKDNIKTIATNNAVLGGSWYVLDVNVVPSVKSGEVLYEDGHIQSSASFKYEFDSVTGELVVKNFVVKK